ncbi:isoprenylcysteine carboxylmethyltransferase family protein [Thermoleptolyngbya sp. PKUAC-SCTB121]|nr:isoprenylcysteine carboxylmethyltransferase family protein [Thermoleptolyngbya sp. PKUAC-SCTB121]
MKPLTDWGFSREDWWQGKKGEYWVILQAVLLLGLLILPTVPVPGLVIEPPLRYGLWAIAALCALTAAIFLGKGLLDLGQSLTPLPYPREDGQLVQTGVYRIVRHPIYSGVIFAVLAIALYRLSGTHLLAALVFFIFFNAKAAKEEAWLQEKYPDYVEYKTRVKRLIPWLY